MSTPSNNYAPPQSAVADVSTGDEAFERASRGSRLLAVILDSIIFTIPLSVSYATTFRTILADRASAGNPFHVWATMYATGVPFYIGSLINLVLLGITAMLVYKNGQTIAKKLLGIKVVRTDGSRASFARIFWLRNVLNTVIMFVPLFGGLYSLVDSLMIFGKARRCCHDLIADTIVIRA